MDNLIRLAREFAFNAHQNQKRKVSGELYFTHVEQVAEIVKEAGFSKEIIAAGYLHDVLEDTDVTDQELGSLFGDKVLEYVLANTENKSLSWEERKAETIKKAKVLPLEFKALIAADKLDNSRDLLLHKRTHGLKVWDSFNRGADQQAWYYHHLTNALFKGIDSSIIPSYFHELRHNVDILFQEELS
ncbi:HD domain-containing protein [Bacillus weihaiensis]|uniref:HD/PDEase domain-containing protein n=1 Tax=Bacillus weihaiensis TaxID=1547283 RepID=A0A1L3MT26_9BACI|nr:HD domain-containing protein [Bacillus weihaiensis]APH05493.1 hypothetical protein A9C19_12420 [Bacillus weihaiensis]